MLRIVSIIRHRAADTTRKMQMRLVISLILFLSFCCVLCRFFFFFSLSLSLFWSEGVVVPSCGLHTLHVRIQLGNMQIRIVSPEEMRLNSTHGRCLSFFKIFSSCVDFVYSLTLFFHRHKSTGDIHFVLCFPSISLSFWIPRFIYFYTTWMSSHKEKYSEGNKRKWTNSENGARKLVLPHLGSPPSAKRNAISKRKKERKKTRPHQMQFTITVTFLYQN